MAALIDTNVLVYRFDPRFPEKQARANRLLRKGVAADDIRLAHQTLVEFVAAVSRPLPGRAPLLAVTDARREAEDMLSQFVVVYPDAEVVRLAVRGAAAYQLGWFDAHMWAYAEHCGLDTLYSEGFQHDRLYGKVRVVNPFV
ncbi:MAG TPA: PIN domain-containing protein [Longimicrobiales bacterium]|nr:PIN domain-containing protein [Longimicrobiales bacterium]